MSNDKNIVDEFLKSSLSGLEGDVSFSDWEAIEAQLDAKGAKRPVAWYWTAAAVIVLGLGSLLVWNTFSNKPTHQDELPSPELVNQSTEANAQGEKTLVPESIIGDQREEGTLSNSEESISSGQSMQSSIKPHSSESHRSGEMNALTAEAENILPTKNVDNMPVDSVSKGDRIPGFSTVDALKGKDIVQDEIKDGIEQPAPENMADITVAADTDKTADQTKGSSGEDIQTKPQGWRIGLHASPNWANKLIQDNGVNAWKINPKYKDYVKSMENGSFSYQVQARVDKDLRHNFYIGTGLNYNQIQEAVSYDYIVDGYYTEQVQQKRLTYVAWNPALHYRVQHSGTNTYHYVEVPMRLGWSTNVLNSKFNLKIETSVRYMYLAGMKGQRLGITDMRALEDLSEASDLFERSNFGLTTNAGIYYNASDAWEFGFVPFYGRALTSIRNKEAGIKEKPYNTGVNLGLHYKLKTK